jgi:cytochrome c peroxidase
VDNLDLREKMYRRLSVCGTPRWLKLAVFVALFLMGLMGWRESSAQQKLNPLQVRLGERLFREQRFTTAKGDLAASCAICHNLDEDPQGTRAFTDFFNRSWVPFRSEDPRRLGLRNSPTLFDVAQMPLLHHDGEFKSLEELVAGTLSGRNLGWLPGEEEQAFNQVQSVLLADKGGTKEASYREQFKSAFKVELDALSRDQVIGWVSKAVADFMRTLNSKQNAPYDRFARVNGLDLSPAFNKQGGESGKAYAQWTLAKLSELEAKGALKLARDFDQTAVDGFKIFLRAEGKTSVGNCAACHAPPLFTDFSFHNLGLTQLEYDQFHGEGKFAAIPIPNAAKAARPLVKFREYPSPSISGQADLGFWNFIDLKTSPLRRNGENDDQLLARMIGAFKTPTLRHLAYSQPYMHNGAFSSLEEVLRQLIRVSEMSRAGRIRQADEELPKIRLTEADIAPLLAFLSTLNEGLTRE